MNISTESLLKLLDLIMGFIRRLIDSGFMEGLA